MVGFICIFNRVHRLSALSSVVLSLIVHDTNSVSYAIPSEFLFYQEAKSPRCCLENKV